MLPTKILKLRLSRIQKGKEHLSTQDKLMLVSMESPDLSAHFLLRLFKVSLPKHWKFKHENDEDILYSTELIQLIEDELLAAYEFHARKYAWYEQCLMYRLNFIVTQPTQQQMNGYLRQLDRCLDQQPKIELLNYFQQHYPTAQHAIALAKAYAGAAKYDQAIEWYEWAAQQSTQRNAPGKGTGGKESKPRGRGSGLLQTPPGHPQSGPGPGPLPGCRRCARRAGQPLLM